jgi:hypothetical protein
MKCTTACIGTLVPASFRDALVFQFAFAFFTMTGSLGCVEERLLRFFKFQAEE